MNTPTLKKMATRQGEVVDYKFVEEISDDLTCSICMKVLCLPHLVNCCEQQFCKSCLETWCQANKSCPHCRSTDFVKVLLKQKSRKIGELKVYCPNKKHGCESILKISDYDNHLSTANAKGCQYVLVNCPYNCAHQLTIRRSQMKKHKERQCPRRPFNCVHCKVKGEHEVITGEHLKICPSYPLYCPQKCGATVLRKDLEAHKDTCPEGLAACPFSELGCKVKVHRKDLEKHVETSAVQHMTVLAQSHLSLKAEHAALKDDHAAIKDEHAALKVENEALKKSCTKVHTKLNTAGAVLKNLRNNPQVAQMYPLLVDTSELTMGTWLFLSLSETNMESGHHYIIVSKYKFKLEWQRLQDYVPQCPQDNIPERHVRQHYGLQSLSSYGGRTRPSVASSIAKRQLTPTHDLYLYLVVDDIHPTIAKSWSCDVTVRNATKKLAVICNREEVAPDPFKKEAIAIYSLLGTSEGCFSYSPLTLEIQFNTHDSSACGWCRHR